MSAPLAEFVWKNGKIVPWAEATVHVMTHALHYGTCVFEGIRIYDTHKGPAIFRLSDHMDRLLASGKIYGITPPYSAPELGEATRHIVGANKLQSGYIRPIVFLGECGMSVCPKPGTPTDVVILCFPLGRYLGADAIEQGVDVCVSTWRRPAPSTTPAAAKAAGNYLSGVLIGREAQSRGFVEGIALGADGRLSEGAGENLFIVKNGKLLTPPAGDSILFGITRDTVMKLAEDLGIPVVEQSMPREMLYLADEVFLTGTAAEITPVRSVDRIQVGEGRRGPVTRAIQDAFFGLFDGRTEDRRGWLEPVAAHAKTAAE